MKKVIVIKSRHSQITPGMIGTLLELKSGGAAIEFKALSCPVSGHSSDKKNVTVFLNQEDYRFVNEEKAKKS